MRLIVESVQARLKSRNAAVEARWRVGFVHPGGAVGGNPRYGRMPFTYHGLVSNEAPILQAFIQRQDD
jgi:hypothetical protein